jgi:histidyl-tRNA synthetase
VEQLGGPQTPAVGFAAGIERILLACSAEKSFMPQNEVLDFYLIRLSHDLSSEVFRIASLLRKDNFKVEFDYLDRSVKAQMREANKLNSNFVIFIGGDEHEKGQMQIKNMKSGDQIYMNADQIKSISSLINY